MLTAWDRTLGRLSLALSAAVTAWWGLPWLARAQEAAEERATSFKAVTGAVKEDVPGGPLLLGAYAAILVLLVAYGLRLARMQQRSQDELARLARQLEAASRAAGDARK